MTATVTSVDTNPSPSSVASALLVDTANQGVHGQHNAVLEVSDNPRNIEIDVNEISAHSLAGNDVDSNSNVGMTGRSYPTHPQQFMALQSSSQSFNSQFYGAIFNVQNFNYYSTSK